MVNKSFISYFSPYFPFPSVQPPPPRVPDTPASRRSLSTQEKTDYINAVKCIMAKPALTPAFPNTGVISRYDDLVYTHIQQTNSVHYVGHFLAWHRYFTATYEKMLRSECGYQGAQPYWDWTLDTPAASYVNSPVFDPVTGFGGNGPFEPSDPNGWFEVPGRTGGGCVSDGPWAGLSDVVHLGPGANVEYNPQCLRRDLSPYFAARYLGMNQTALTLSQPDFGWFNAVVEGKPDFEDSGVHGGGHYGVGGTLGMFITNYAVVVRTFEWTRFLLTIFFFSCVKGTMGDLFISPADPIFHLHHANLDRLWWSWQKLNLSARLVDISGPALLMDYSQGNSTLDTPLSLGPSAVDLTVRDVMNIEGCGAVGVCYTYDNLYTL